MSLLRNVRSAAVALGLAVGVAVAPAHAALLGLAANEPTIDVLSGGVIAYDAATGIVTISAEPGLLIKNPDIFAEVMGRTSDDEKLFTIKFKVNSSGALVGGVEGADLQVIGAVDTDYDGIADYDGVLLEAEVSAFGFQDAYNGTTDRFDLRLTGLSGALAPLFEGKDLAVVIDSEQLDDYPSPFAGTFAAAFTGPVKGTAGSTDPVVVSSCEVHVDAYCSVNGGPNKSVCRIAKTKSPKHWEWVTHYCRGRAFSYYKYGMHGDPVPAWASRYPATNVKFTYVVKNTGTTTISNLQVIDSLYGDVTGVPATLAPGASVTLTRTEPLRDEFFNKVLVLGESGSAACSDKDSVVVKDKVRKLRRHDYDRFEGKGDHDKDPDRR